jgi:Fe-Mn family superoxide dismutase
MTYKLPDLPYDYSALEPVISGKIMQLHHNKHHAAYVNNLNAALEKYHAAEAKQDLPAMIALEPAIRFNGGGHINHSHFWTHLAPEGKGGGGEPHAAFMQEIKKEFGTFEAFVEKFSALTVGIQGSGWGWLGYNKTHGRVVITTCANQDPLSTQNLVPLLGIDVWEHAYYLQYENVRADYVKNIWKIINWKAVEDSYLKAKA